MQRTTIDYVHTRHSPDERVGHREAAYQRDEVSGPLSGAHSASPVDDDVNHGKRLKKTVHEETTEILEEEVEQTPSEANVSTVFIVRHSLQADVTISFLDRSRLTEGSPDFE